MLGGNALTNQTQPNTTTSATWHDTITKTTVYGSNSIKTTFTDSPYNETPDLFPTRPKNAIGTSAVNGQWVRVKDDSEKYINMFFSTKITIKEFQQLYKKGALSTETYRKVLRSDFIQSFKLGNHKNHHSFFEKHEQDKYAIAKNWALFAQNYYKVHYQFSPSASTLTGPDIRATFKKMDGYLTLILQLPTEIQDVSKEHPLVKKAITELLDLQLRYCSMFGENCDNGMVISANKSNQAMDWHDKIFSNFVDQSKVLQQDIIEGRTIIEPQLLITTIVPNHIKEGDVAYFSNPKTFSDAPYLTGTLTGRVGGSQIVVLEPSEFLPLFTARLISPKTLKNSKDLEYTFNKCFFILREMVRLSQKLSPENFEKYYPQLPQLIKECPLIPTKKGIKEESEDTNNQYKNAF